jgi:succinate dehydrogenase/fumarate reductase iron-sulfur protein
MNPKNERTKTYRFEILRCDGASAAPPQFQAYELAVDRQTSVLEALWRIQDEQDPSLAFRYSCRGAICGSCGMSINGNLNLACRVQLQALPAGRVVLEPLPGLEVLKDLVVEMEPFWDKYERIRPWLHAEISAAKESRMTDQERARIDQYVHCILCGLCYSACPAVQFDPAFTGPAALAKLHRFLADARDHRGSETFRSEDSEQGAWGCHTIMKCVDVCPKDVRPADGIRAVRRRLFVDRVKHLVPRKPHED